jgi:hypothetical protein
MSFLPIGSELGVLKILEVLDWYDGPRLFIAEDPSGTRYIAFWADETEEESLWLYSSVSEDRISNVTSGKLDLRSIYTNPENEIVFLIRLKNNNQSSALVEKICPNQIEQKLLPPCDDFLSLNEGFFAESKDLATTENTGILTHEINISRPRSNAIIGFESLSSVATNWSRLIHSVLNTSPILVSTSVGSLIVELQTDTGDELPNFFNRLHTLINSPTCEHINNNFSDQERKLLELFLGSLHKDKLTLSTKITSLPDQPSLVLSHSVIHELRLALIDFNQKRVESIKVPQADDLNKLFRMLELIDNGESNIGYQLSLSPRQVKYYQQAARILDLLNENDLITSRGKYLLNFPQVIDRYKVAMLLFESSPVGFAWLSYCNQQSIMTLDPESALDFLESRSSNLSSNTIGRRSKTLRTWVLTFQTQGINN